MASQEQRMLLAQKILKSRDENIDEFLHTVDHVVVYQHKDENWEKLPIEGSLYFLKRKQSPFYVLLVVNRKSKSNFELSLKDSRIKFDFPYVLIKKKKTYGLWFYSKTSMDDLAKSLTIHCRSIVVPQKDASAKQEKSTNSLSELETMLKKTLDLPVEKNSPFQSQLQNPNSEAQVPLLHPSQLLNRPNSLEIETFLKGALNLTTSSPNEVQKAISIPRNNRENVSRRNQKDNEQSKENDRSRDNSTAQVTIKSSGNRQKSKENGNSVVILKSIERRPTNGKENGNPRRIKIKSRENVSKSKENGKARDDAKPMIRIKKRNNASSETTPKITIKARETKNTEIISMKNPISELSKFIPPNIVNHSLKVNPDDVETPEEFRKLLISEIQKDSAYFNELFQYFMLNKKFLKPLSKPAET